MNNTRDYYNNLIKEKNNYFNILKDIFQSIFFGGLISMMGQFLYEVLQEYMTIENARSYLIISFIAIASILTGLGLFDKCEKIFKMGLAIPITGFSNSITSTMLDYKREGFVAGIGSNTFKLAGSVLLYGSLAGIIMGLIRYLIEGKI